MTDAERIAELEAALRSIISISYKGDTPINKTWPEIEAIVWSVLSPVRQSNE